MLADITNCDTKAKACIDLTRVSLCTGSSECITAIVANMHSLRPCVEVVASWESDMTVLHETKRAGHAIGQTAAAI